jgi:hypothetical protein
MESGTSEHGWDILSYLGKRHERIGIFLGLVSKLLKGCECFLIAQLQHQLVRLDNREVEGDDLVEKGLIGGKPRVTFRFIVQDLPNGSGCFRHASDLLLVR